MNFSNIMCTINNKITGMPNLNNSINKINKILKQNIKRIQFKENWMELNQIKLINNNYLNQNKKFLKFNINFF